MWAIFGISDLVTAQENAVWAVTLILNQNTALRSNGDHKENSIYGMYLGQSFLFTIWATAAYYI